MFFSFEFHLILDNRPPKRSISLHFYSIVKERARESLTFLCRKSLTKSRGINRARGDNSESYLIGQEYFFVNELFFLFFFRGAENSIKDAGERHKKGFGEAVLGTPTRYSYRNERQSEKINSLDKFGGFQWVQQHSGAHLLGGRNSV